jgi:hypothetical protein
MDESTWPTYWVADLPADRRQKLEVELQRELPPGHMLYGKTVVAKAIGYDPDDVVFQLEDGKFAAVHLTWKVESDTNWPFTLLFDSLKSLGESDEWG